MQFETTIEKLVHGGQGLGTLADGRKIFVWNGLPGERVIGTLFRGKKRYGEGLVEQVLQPSSERIVPKDEAYLSTSPWQIMTFAAENRYKQEILGETMQREHVAFDGAIGFHAGQGEWCYRNKMEYSFYGDDDGLHLALFNRGTHRKQIVTGSSIAMPAIDEVANKICEVLNQAGVRGSQLKTVIIRGGQNGDVVAAVFVKDEAFPILEILGSICKGMIVYYSNPKSPASVITRELYRFGNSTLTDDILDMVISYDVNSFFQVNLEIFNQAAAAIQSALLPNTATVDLYSGVGTIGIPTGATTLVEIDTHNVEMARQNVTHAGRPITVVQASTEGALECITSDTQLIVDPPRAGLHSAVTERLLAALPPRIIYLSCNPITQARDLALLQESYRISSIEGYNFFPRTPHIESLAVLERIS